MPIPDRDEPATKQAADDGDRVRTLFKSVAVFDVSQTEALPGREAVVLEPPSQPITGDSHAHLLDPLTAFAARLGYRVEQRTLNGPAGGWCDAEHKLIVVDAGRQPNARVRVLVHELAHAMGIGYTDLGRQRAEVMVDCVTYIVCGQLGLDTAGESIPYVAGWGEDGALDAIQAYAQTIDEVSRRIYDEITASQDTSVQDGDLRAAA